MKVAVGLRRVAAGKRTSGRRAAQIAAYQKYRNCLVPIQVRGFFSAVFQTFARKRTRDFLRFFFCAVKEETVCILTRKNAEEELQN